MTTSNKSDDSTKGNTSWQMEVLMEKLRSKACSLRSLPESAKMIKQSILNKQHILDPGEKAALGQCLDKLQQNIKVTSLSAMVERLEATARQLGLQFTSGTSGPEVYISCDMFYVEVHLQTEGKVRDVKVELAGDQHKPRGQSSPELVECLSNGYFTDFMAHLEGFLSIYKLNTEKKNKCKAYQALQALELDLLKLFEMAQETITDTHRLIFKSPVGLLINRKGGHPVKMIYFNSPYELLDVDAQRSVSLTYETASSMDLAHFVSVNIEASTSHKLQTTSLVNIIKGNDGLKLPSISGLNSSNSVSLPAYFALRLKNPMAVSYTLACKIGEVTGIPCFDTSTKQSLLPLIIRQATDVQPDTNNNKGLFVTLPDQQHCYFMPTGTDFEGVIVHRVPFTHPTSVAHILEYLRMQAVFNSLITSCVRPSSKQELENAFIFEVSAVSHEFISVTFEHPEEESTATAELDLTDLSNVRCRLFTLSKDVTLCSDEYATKVLQRCLSIPVTMRAVIRKVAKEEKELVPLGDSVVKMENNNLSSDPNQNTKFLFSDYNSFGVRRDQVLPSHGSGLNNVVTKSPSSTQGMYEEGMDTSTTTSPSRQPTGPAPGSYSSLLAGSLSQKNQFQHHFLADGKTAKVRKRKSTLETDRKSPKFGDDIVIEVSKKGAPEALLNDVGLHIRRDVKFEKVSSVISKRRSSSDGGLSPTGPNELAALREKVYGAGSAASFAKLSYMHSSSKDTKDLKDSTSKKIKKHKSEGRADGKKALPIVLDLTDAESTKKASLAGSPHSSALSAALLKRPGIEIIPIPGSNTPISIPSSITVTPVMKSSEDKFKDKKDKRDRKDLDKKDKKRRRDDSPGGSSGSGASSLKPSKIQIISTNAKHTSTSTTISSLESFKGDKSSSGVTVKPSASYQSPIKKPSLSPTLSQKGAVQSKVTFSPSHKPNKLLYSPTHSISSSSSSASATTTSSSSASSSTSSFVSSACISPSTSSSSCTTTSISTSTASSSSSSTSSSSTKSTTSPKQCPPSPKHSSMGKPSMNALKGGSPTFSKPSSLSPKLGKGSKEREKSCSPSRPSVSPVPPGGSSPGISPSVKSKGLVSSGEKVKGGFSEALTITKVSSGETLPSASVALSCGALSPPFPHGGGPPTGSTAASLMEKLSADKAKASPPKNRKGSSLSDIVDKLRAGVTGSSSEGLTLLERREKEKREGGKAGGGGQEGGKKDGDNFMIKTSTGLKFTINKAKASKDSSSNAKSSTSSSTGGGGFTPPSSNTSPNPKGAANKSPSGLKPGVTSGPASKKVSMASLPPIPKLPPASISNVTATAISPLGNSLSMTSPLQYGRERQRESKGEREREKERVQASDSKPKKESSGGSKSNNNVFPPSEVKKDSSEKGVLAFKQSSKEDIPLQQQQQQQQPRTFAPPPLKKPSSAADTVDRALKNIFGEDDNPPKGNLDFPQENDSGEYFERTLPLSLPPTSKPLSGSFPIEGKGKVEPLLCGTLKEMSADTMKEATASMPPPATPSAHVKPPPPPSPDKSSSSSSTTPSSSSSSCAPSSSCISSISSSSISSTSSCSSSTPIPSSLESVSQMDKEKEPFTTSLPPPLPPPAPPPPLLPHRAPPSPPGLSFPPSPSVSIKIVKSPAPVTSPLNMISPQSVSSQHSPCIIDDDLMDEAVMGSRK